MSVLLIYMRAEAIILMIPQKVVTPAKAGAQRIHNLSKTLDSGFCRNDG